MAAPAPLRTDDIEIPDRPSVASEPARTQTQLRRILLYGGIAALALVVLTLTAMLVSGKRNEVARSPADAPLIKAEDQPIKVSPESRGGLEIPNRDILVYGHMHGSTGGAPPIERLLPEPEQPIAPPSPPSRPASPPDAAPSSEHAATTGKSPAEEPAAPPSSPAAKSPAAIVAQAKIPPTGAPPSTSKLTQPGRPAKGSGYLIQLVSSRSEVEAKAAWARLKSKNGDVLGSLSPTVAPADLGDRGTFYRLRAGPIATEAKAKSICRSLAERGVSCLLVHASG
jgi:cell division septation protein DedD